MSPTTEVTVATGDRSRVDGDAKHVEQIIPDPLAVRSMQLAWLVETETGDYRDQSRLRGDSANCRLLSRLPIEQRDDERPLIELAAQFAARAGGAGG
jgi:hypothetical protein